MKVILLTLSLLGCTLAMPVGVDESDNPRPVVPLVITDYSSVANKAAESTAAPSSESTATISAIPAKDNLEPQPTEASTELASPSTENDAIRNIDGPTPNLQDTAKVTDQAAESMQKEEHSSVAQVAEARLEETKEELKAVPLASDITVPQVYKDTIVPQDAMLEKQASEKTEITKDAPVGEQKAEETPIKLEEKEVKNSEDIELSSDGTENPATVAPVEKMDKEAVPEEKIKDDSSSEESKEKADNPSTITETQSTESQQEKKIETVEEKKETSAENKGEEKKPEDSPTSRRRRHVKEDIKPVEENKKPTTAPKKEKDEKKGKSESVTKVEEEVKPTESLRDEETKVLEEIIPQMATVQEQSDDQKDLKDKLNSEEKVVSDETDKQTMEPAKTENKREVSTEEKKEETEMSPKPEETKKDESETVAPKAELPKEQQKEEVPRVEKRNEEERKEEQSNEKDLKEELPIAASEKISETLKDKTAIEKKGESIEKIPGASVEKDDSPLTSTLLSTTEEKNTDSQSDESS